VKIGVLALQGSFAEHIDSLKGLKIDCLPVRKADELDAVDGLILPGGESTTIGRLARLYGLDQKIKARAAEGMPVYGTCAGMILLAREISSGEPAHLGLMDITVTRNASGRQVDSYEVDLPVPPLGDKPFRAVFIRAPYVDRVGEGVQVLACVHDKPVFVRQGQFLASAFHPELTDDRRVHAYFAEMVEEFLGR